VVGVSTAGVVTGVRITHDRASVDAIEAASLANPEAAVRELVAAEVVSEAFVLSTCNRVEAYVVADDRATGRDRLAAFFGGVPDDLAVETGHEASLRHLLRVAAGLDSMVVGEDQILGQVRDAYDAAREVDALGPVLDDALLKAIHVGERARVETAINEGAVSIGSAAATLASEHRDLDGATALVVGAGEMGTLAAHALADAGVARLVVAHRTARRAGTLAADVATDARAVDLDALDDPLVDASVVVAATDSTEPVLSADDIADAGDTLVVDLGQPRNVDPAAGEHERVALYDLDDLESVTDDTLVRRRAAADRVETMVEREFSHLLDHQKRRRADEVIAAMYESAETIKARELETAFARLDASGEVADDQREVVESLADALVSQLLAAPTKSLRDAAAADDWETIHTALKLFDPEFGDEAPEFVRELLAEGADIPEDAPADVSAGVEDD
jgi:glutamyl-tRNA reductase